jgi:hypothetical protein
MKIIKNCKLVVYLLQVVMVSIFLCWSVGVVTASTGNGALRIIYSGGLTGNIEPCG